MSGLCQVVKLVELTRYGTLAFSAQLSQVFIKYYKSSHSFKCVLFGLPGCEEVFAVPLLILQRNACCLVLWGYLKAVCLLFAVEWTDKMLAVFLTG